VNKILPDLTYTKQAFEVDPHLRMQSPSKPGGLTPIVLAVWVCAAVEARAQFQCPGSTTPSNISQNSPAPASQKKTDITDIVDILGYSRSHMTSLA